MPPEEYHHGPQVDPERSRRGRSGQRGRGGPRGRSGRRRWGPQQGGVEAPVEDIVADQSGDYPEPHDASYDLPPFILQLSQRTLQVTLSAPVLITGTAITQQKWDQHFPDRPEPSTVAVDRPI